MGRGWKNEEEKKGAQKFKKFVYLTQTSEASLLHLHLSVPVALKASPISIHASRSSLWRFNTITSHWLSFFHVIASPKVRGPGVRFVCENNWGEAHVAGDEVITGHSSVSVLCLIISPDPCEPPTFVVTNILNLNIILVSASSGGMVVYGIW